MLVDLLIALACISAGLSFLILIDQYRKEAKDNGAWGDFPHLHEEMRTGSRERLGGAKHDGPRLGVEHDIAHRDEGYTS
jgi:hypothetical protein